MGIQDKAKHLATMYLEDLSDLIKECVDAHFGFSRYAERLGRSANSFDELYECLQQPYTYIDELLDQIFLKNEWLQVQPETGCHFCSFSRQFIYLVSLRTMDKKKLSSM